jgi:hypothetical protein
MKIILKNVSFLLLLTAAMVSCKKDEFNGLSDMRPDVPVIVTNAVAFRPDPAVAASVSAGGAIQIVLEIPENTGRTIKEVTRIALSNSYTRIQGTTNLFNTAPIPVNSRTWTFNTSLAEYTARGGGAIPPVSTNAATELTNRFYFLVTLDDGRQVIPMAVRILVRS